MAEYGPIDPDEETYICENCGDEFASSEMYGCEHCGLDPLCEACCEMYDHDCEDGPD